ARRLAATNLSAYVLGCATRQRDRELLVASHTSNHTTESSETLHDPGQLARDRVFDRLGAKLGGQHVPRVRLDFVVRRDLMREEVGKKRLRAREPAERLAE